MLLYVKKLIDTLPNDYKSIYLLPNGSHADPAHYRLTLAFIFIHTFAVALLIVTTEDERVYMHTLMPLHTQRGNIFRQLAKGRLCTCLSVAGPPDWFFVCSSLSTIRKNATKNKNILIIRFLFLSDI